MSAQLEKSAGFLLLGLLILLAYSSFKVFSGEVSLPYNCSGRSQLFCEFVNIAFKQSGFLAVGVLTLGASIFVFVIAYSLVTSDIKIYKSNGILAAKTAKAVSKHDENKR